MTYFILYTIIAPLLCYFCYRYCKRKYIPFLFLAIISAIRYDTTSDYHNYVREFYSVLSGELLTDKQLSEFGYIYLNKLFGFSEWGFIGIFALASSFIYLSFYNYFKKEQILCLGVYLFLCFECATNFDNIIRQGIAIAIFNFAVFFFWQKRYLYAITLCLVAPVFHTSAYVLGIFFPMLFLLKKMILPKREMIIGVVIVFLLYFSGIFDEVRERFFTTSFMINSVYGDYTDVEFSKNHIGVAFMIKAFVCLMPLSIVNKTNDSFKILCINMSWVSIILGVVFAGIPFFYRINYYLTIFNILSVSFCISYYFKRKRVVSYGMLFFVYVLLINHVSFYYGFNSIYRTVFSSNCKEHRFYVRQTFEDVQTDRFDKDRNHYYIMR